MRADATPLNDVLLERQQWVVPVYQRHYEWETGEDKQLPKLWGDLMDRSLESLVGRTPYPHYFGAIIVSAVSNQQPGVVRERYLVDGQQRITTFQLTLATIREVAREHGMLRLIDSIDAYLYNEIGRGMANPERERFKLWPSNYDRSLYQNIIENPPEKIKILHNSFFFKNGNLKKTHAPNLLRAYWYLYTEIKKFVQDQQVDDRTPEQVLDTLFTGFLDGFQIVEIQLDPNDDEQEIFSSLNGLGKPLSPFDLIRNDVFRRARATGEDIQNIFDDHWKIFEQPFWNEQVRQGRLLRARADHLVTHAVVAETAREVNVGKIATEYKHYAQDSNFHTIAQELDILRKHADTYRKMEEKNQDVPYKGLAKVLRIWDMSVFHPLILWIESRQLKDSDRVILYNLIETYVVRRELCGLTAKNYNRVVCRIIRSASTPDDPVAAIIDFISSQEADTSRMPLDEEIKEEIASRDVYYGISKPRLRYILREIERTIRNPYDEEVTIPDNLTIEHVMPLSWAKHWPLPNGISAPCVSIWEVNRYDFDFNEEIHKLMTARQEAVNTLGNLTLLTNSLNPHIGNGPWEKKREKLSESLLVLNRNISNVTNWDENSIATRTTELTNTICKIWNPQMLT